MADVPTSKPANDLISEQANELVIDLADETATMELGAKLAGLSAISGLVFLHGELGAGKTTLVRGFLRALGYQGAVKSPTYTLIEPYEFGQRSIYHLDIYRLGDAEELDYLGVRDLINESSTLLVEWPDRAMALLGKADLEIFLEYQGDRRKARIISRHGNLLQQVKKAILN